MRPIKFILILLISIGLLTNYCWADNFSEKNGTIIKGNQSLNESRISSFQPKITSVSPSVASNAEDEYIQFINITGTNFSNSAAVTLRNDEIELPYSNYGMIYPDKMSLAFPFKNAPTGSYNLRVDNGGGDITEFPNALAIVNALNPSITSVDPVQAYLEKTRFTIKGGHFKRMGMGTIVFLTGQGVQIKSDDFYVFNGNTIYATFDLQNGPAPTGTYNLTVKNKDGNSAELFNAVNVVIKVPGSDIYPPVANFTSNVTSGPEPLTVQFIDFSTKNPNKWLWEFGDGEKSEFRDPVHIYTSAGLFTVNLTVNNSAGNDAKVSPGYINATKTKLPPIANFTVNNTIGSVPLTLQFTDTSTISPDTWHWIFGDGGTSELRDPIHTYSTAGHFTVSLTVSNLNGEDTRVFSSYINASEKPTPTADFTFTPSITNVSQNISFISEVNGPDLGPLLWNFGDGTPSIDTINPVHQYKIPGRYNVTLTVTSPYGKASVMHIVPVRGLIPGFEISPSSDRAFVNTSIIFKDTSKGDPVEWFWDFGDGTNQGTNRNIIAHTYTKAGIYLVNMQATNWQPITASTTPKELSIENITFPKNVNFNPSELK